MFLCYWSTKSKQVQTKETLIYFFTPNFRKPIALTDAIAVITCLLTASLHFVLIYILHISIF